MSSIEEINLEIDQAAQEKLAMLWLKKASLQLSLQDAGFEKSMERVRHFAALDYDALLEAGNLYALKQASPKLQQKASEVFEELTHLDPERYEAWYFFGKNLLLRANLDDCEEFLVEANRHFQRAEELAIPEQKISIHQAWGQCWQTLFKYSNEVHDLKIALYHFKTSASLGNKGSDFFECYGACFEEMGRYMGQDEWILEGIKQYQSAKEPNEAKIACAQSYLFEKSYKKIYFEEAVQSYARAHAQNPTSDPLRARWVRLLLRAGAFYRESRIIHAALKLLKEGKLSQNLLEIRARLQIGILEEDFESLKTAEKQILNLIHSEPDDAEHWYLYGRVLQALSEYFDDEKQLENAIEKYQQTLVLDPTHLQAKHAIAKSLTELGSNSQLEEALTLFSSVAKERKLLSPLFWCDWGIAYLILGQNIQDPGKVRSAIQCFEEALAFYKEENYQNLELLYYYGCALDFYGDYAEDLDYYARAREILGDLIERDPEHYEARYHYAQALSHFGETVSDIEVVEQASEQFAYLIQQNPEDERVWNDWGLCFMILGELKHDPLFPDRQQSIWGEAEYKLLRASQLGHNSAYYHLACLFSLSGVPARAVEMLERAERARVLPSIAEMQEDVWLSAISKSPEYQSFVLRLQQKEG